MASKLMLSLLVAVFMMLGMVKGATHHAPAPSVDCSSLVLTMADCLSFVTNGSTIKKPEGGCCSGLKNVLKTDAACVCEAFKNTAQFGVVLNITKASTLPALCNVKAPSITNCGISVSAPAANSPTASAGAPAGKALSPANAPDTAGITSPTTAPQSNASVVSVSFVALISVFLASCLYI